MGPWTELYPIWGDYSPIIKAEKISNISLRFETRAVQPFKSEWDRKSRPNSHFLPPPVMGVMDEMFISINYVLPSYTSDGPRAVEIR